MQNRNNIKTFFSALLIFIFISLSLSVWLMSVYFIKYGIPVILGREWYPVMLMSIPIFILFLVLFIFSIFLYNRKRILISTYALLSITFIMLFFLLSSVFSGYKYSPQRIVLRFTGMGGKTVHYKLKTSKYGKTTLSKNTKKAYLIYTGTYFYYFATKNKVVGINKEICHVKKEFKK